MLNLRPHHIQDIVRNIGNGRKIVPHPYGHELHIVTQKIIGDVHQECRLVVANDDVCGPCIHLRNGKCDDILPQLVKKTSKQDYNNKLDTEILTFLEIKENSVLTIAAYLKKVKENLPGIAAHCTHPGEDKTVRKAGLEKGLHLLGIT